MRYALAGGAESPAAILKTYTVEDFKKWGAQGPKRRKSNRTLSPEQAKAMVEAREKKRRKMKRVARQCN